MRASAALTAACGKGMAAGLPGRQWAGMACAAAPQWGQRAPVWHHPPQRPGACLQAWCCAPPPRRVLHAAQQLSSWHDSGSIGRALPADFIPQSTQLFRSRKKPPSRNSISESGKTQLTSPVHARPRQRTSSYENAQQPWWWRQLSHKTTAARLGLSSGLTPWLGAICLTWPR